MALWWTLAIAVTCLSGLTSPGPVPSTTDLRELISELRNISQNQVSKGWPGSCLLGCGVGCPHQEVLSKLGLILSACGSGRCLVG